MRIKTRRTPIIIRIRRRIIINILIDVESELLVEVIVKLIGSNRK